MWSARLRAALNSRFSDHSPYPFPDGYDSGMRMRLDQVEGYVDTRAGIEKEYDKDIESISDSKQSISRDSGIS